MCFFSFHEAILVPLQGVKMLYVLTSGRANSPTIFFKIVLVIPAFLLFCMDFGISIYTFYMYQYIYFIKQIIKNFFWGGR